MRRVLPKAGIAAVVFATAGSAYAHYVTGYAVSNHRACGVSNLPGTIPELELFFASSDFPADLAKNALWTNTRVRAAEWGAGSDRYENRDTASGFDGVDAPLLSYIASHGTTRAGKYTAYAGGGEAGCQIKSHEMGIGDQEARYLVLSTCQGVKVGNGDDPNAAGEDPRVTWREASRGLNCVFGYSNNMADDDKYGVNLLNLLATTDLSLTQAFFRASRLSSYANVPAVLCFGPDESAARAHLESDRRFVAERYGSGASAYAWERPARLSGAFDAPASGSAVRRLVLAPRLPNLVTLARTLVGSGTQDVSARQGLSVRRSERGTLTVDQKSGIVTWVRSGAMPFRPFKATDAAAVRIATEFARKLGLIGKGEAWAPTYLIEHGVSRGSGTVTTDKTVVFHQLFGALPAIGTRGSLEVRLDSDGELMGFTAAAVDAWPEDIRSIVQAPTVDVTKAEREALARLARSHPDAKLAVVETRVGYATGAANTTEPTAAAVVEVLIAVERDGVGRRHVERIAL
jgi:hypothetical protein